MKNIFYNGGDLGIFLEVKDLQDIEKGETLDTYLFREGGEKLNVPLKINFSNGEDFNDGVLNMTSSNPALSKSKFVKICLSKNTIEKLLDVFEKGIVSTSYHHKRIVVYCNFYENFDVLYKNIKN